VLELEEEAMAEKLSNQIAAPKDIVSNVLTLLNALSIQHNIDPLKQLFWSELNYERTNQPLSRRSWPEKTNATLFEDPLLLATGGIDDGFHIIYLRLASDQLSLADERSIVTLLLKDHLDSLFIFSNRSLDTWHFLNIKSDEKNKSRLLFRRITVGPNEQLRTAAERLAMLNIADLDPTLSNISVLKILARHEQAFDVEAVTKKFFERYHAVFEQVEQLIQGFTEPEIKRLFTQRLFNRLMFIAFIQKKGWLKLNGQTDYLPTLWNAYKQSSTSMRNFFSERLELLFFSGLNTDNYVNIVDINRNGFLKTLIGDVPYLNGGLFEKDKDDSNPQLLVPDECIDAILNDLFARFNFTVMESTPLDIEVAVDPEMLGKVFEELVTGRHETGSYYTPKPVVSFMCREALKGYLQSRLPGETHVAIEQFVDEHNPQELLNPESVLDALRRVRVCDPACGSGAYLLGMLHELLDLRTCLFSIKHLDPISMYQRKLEIIQNNIYGVDIDPFAVNIARLRLWLSLEVDFEGPKPQPLPNLDFKIEAGDSLLGPDPQSSDDLNAREYLVQQFREKKAAYISTHSYGEKQTLRKEIAELRQGIFIWTHAGGSLATGFDWSVEFAEVYADGGFDIVVANPPYVRADAQFKHLQPDEIARQAAITNWKTGRELLRKSGIYQTLYEKWDLYIPFLERAYQLLHTNGQMVFIIPDAYNAAKYADKSHEFFLNNVRIVRIDFCSDIFLFSAGVNNTILHFAKTKPEKTAIPLRVRRWGEKPDDFETNVEILPSSSQIELGTALFKPSGTKTINVTSRSIELGKICYISIGMVINADEDGHLGVFKTDELLSEILDKKHPKRFALGKDILKWCLRNVRYLEWGTERAPNQFRRQTFPQLQDAKDKLIAMRTPGITPKVIYDNDRLHFDASSVGFVQWHILHGVRNKSIQKAAKYQDEIKDGDIFPTELREDLERLSQQFNPKYLLAVMNSEFVKQWLALKRRSKQHIYPDDWKSLPIPLASKEEQITIAALAQRCIDAKGVGCEEWEQEIEERVVTLYGI
jgi:type I restriction-modification system DNA methylase subunit